MSARGIGVAIDVLGETLGAGWTRPWFGRPNKTGAVPCRQAAATGKFLIDVASVSRGRFLESR
ncbi:MAG: hypothetical protein WB689_32645, partial [Xanthobacteraceae bacterium]